MTRQRMLQGLAASAAMLCSKAPQLTQGFHSMQQARPLIAAAARSLLAAQPQSQTVHGLPQAPCFAAQGCQVMLMATSLKQQPPPFAGELEDGEFDDDEYIEHYTDSIWSQRQDLLSLYTQQGHALQRDNAPSMQGLDATMLGDEGVPVDRLIEDWSADNMPPLPALPQKPVLRL